MQEAHVLNGDALLYQFPDSISGDKIIMRECLIDGPVKAASIESFFDIRKEFLQVHFGEENVSYQQKVVSQFDKLRLLPNTTNINLWFEQDLFCQTNLWFLCNFLVSQHKTNPIYLIMPEEFSNYGFGALKTEALNELYNRRKPFSLLREFAELWQLYRSDHDKELLELASNLSHEQPYLIEAVQAHVDRKRTEDSMGRPMKSLINIINDLRTIDFRPVFKEFCSREGIYGYGDSQVRILYDEIIDRKLHDL